MIQAFGLLFREHLHRFPRFRIDEIQVHLVLVAIQNLSPDNPFTHPAETRDVGLVIVGQRNPASLSLVDIRHAQLHHRIRVAHLGIFFVIHRRMRRNQIRDGIGGHLGFIHVQEDDLFVVGRPEIIAAHGQLFGIDPVDVAIEQVIVGVAS